MHAHTLTDWHTHASAHARTHTHPHTPPPSPSPPPTPTPPPAYQGNQGNETEEKVLKRESFSRSKRADRGRMADRNRELVPDNWSMVRERALTTGLCSEGWYSEHSGVCRRAELPVKGSISLALLWIGYRCLSLHERERGPERLCRTNK